MEEEYIISKKGKNIFRIMYTFFKLYKAYKE